MAQKFETKIVTVKLEDLLKVVPTFTKKSGEIVVNWSEIEERTTLAHAKTLAGWRTLADGRKQAVLNAIAPTGFSWIRADYGTCVAREEGAVIAGVTFDASCINPFTRMIPKVLMDIVMGSGVQIPGIDWEPNADGKCCGWMRFMTQSAKATDAVLPVVNYAWAKGMEAMFPAAGDTVRPGAFQSPLRGEYHRISVNVLVCEDDDKRYTMLGDGQGIVDREKLAAKGVAFNEGPQFRALIGLDKPWADRVLGKGTLYMERLPDGIDMVLPYSTMKSRKEASLAPGVHTLEIGLGIMNGPGERLAGPIYIGEQIWQWMGSRVMQLADEGVSRSLAGLRERANDFRWLAKHGVQVRDESGNLQQFEIVKLFADVAVQTNNNLIMRSRMMVEAVTDWLATEGYQTIASLNTKAMRFRAVSRKSLSDGFVHLNPKVFKELFGNVKGGVVTVAVRYPFAHENEAVAVTVVADKRVRWYEAHVNGKTMNRAALDFDGDFFAILKPDAHVMALYDLVKDLPFLDEKMRQSAQPPTSRSQMIVQSMAAGIGLIDYAIAKLVAVVHLHPDMRSQALEKIAILRVELQKAVDSVKKAATADMKLVKEAGEWADEYILKRHVAYRQMRKDVLRKPFKLFEGSNEYAVAITVEYFPDVENKETVLVKDRFVLPSMLLQHENEPLVPLAQFMIDHEDEVPLVQQQTVSNGVFAGWIEAIPGDGFKYAAKAVADFNKELQRISLAQSQGKITDDQGQDLRRELFESYRIDWRAKYVEMREDRAWLESAASAIWIAFADGNSKGFALRFSIPEVIAEMLIARKERIPTARAQVGRILGGELFRARYMTQDQELLAVEVTQSDSGLRIAAPGGESHGLKDVSLEPGCYKATVAVTGGKSLSVMFPSESQVMVGDLDMDGGVPEPEWGDIDLQLGDEIEIDIDLM